MGRLEAENMQLTNYVSENITGASSEKGVICKSDSGLAECVFIGLSDAYDIYIGYWDENDGQSRYELFVGDSLKKKWTADNILGSSDPVAQTFVMYTVRNVQLEKNQAIGRRGIKEGD